MGTEKCSAEELVVTRIETAAQLGPLVPSEGFRAVVRTSELAQVLARVLGLGGTVTAALAGPVLAAYVTELPFAPVEFEGWTTSRRWAELPQVRELGSLEVAAPYRGLGIATRLMDALVADSRLEGFNLVGEALVWHWDLDQARLDAYAYRALLLRLLGRAGFERFDTNEPEVTMHPANFLVARLGKQTAPASRFALLGALDSPRI